MLRGSLLAVLLALAPRADAVELYGAIESFLPGRADAEAEREISASVPDVAALGYSVSNAFSRSPALGGRFGARLAPSDLFKVGVSLGYVRGPSTKDEMSAQAPSASGVLSYRRDVQFLRVLAEPELILPFRGSDAALHLAGGAGLARGDSRQTLSCRGAACVQQGTVMTGKTSWAGFTWELSPYVSWRGLALGARYAEFPRFKGSANGTSFSWDTAVFFVGFEF